MALIGYVTTEAYEAAAADRGITLTKDSAQMLTLALDYMQLQSYKGEKTDPAQSLAFPRDGSTEIPPDIIGAQIQAAVIYDQGGDPIGTVGPRVIENTVHGAVTQRFSDSGTSTPIYRKLNAALRPFLSNGGSGLQMVAARG